jgi:hypothetical protein
MRDLRADYFVRVRLRPGFNGAGPGEDVSGRQPRAERKEHHVTRLRQGRRFESTIRYDKIAFTRVEPEARVFGSVEMVSALRRRPSCLTLRKEKKQ